MEEDNAWVFDSLVAFLNGPIWNAPLQSFIEEKSLIFEPNAEENEEYKNIFDEFKNLVDFMLGTFMEDIGITAEQFENACKESKRYQVAFDPNSFEQVWAANDYEMFKKMMAQRNVELQLQALELIEQKYGITPQSFVPHTKNQENVRETPVTIEKSSDLEQNVMEEVSKSFSTDPGEASSSPIKAESILKEKEILEKALEETKEIHKEASAIKGWLSSGNTAAPSHLPDRSVSKKHAINPENKDAINPENNDAINTEKKDAINIEKKDAIITEKKGSIITEKKGSIITEKQDSIITEKKDQLNKSEGMRKEIDAIELKKRQEYLRAQRDKLVALKKEVRRKQLDTGATKSKGRPKSAKAAEAVLSGEKSNIEPQQLQLRKTLAERLRTEVVATNE